MENLLRQLTLENISGSLALIFGIASFFIGLTHQVIKQYKEKRCGLSIIWASLGTLACLSRIFYFIVTKAYWTIPPDAVGLLLSVVVLYQYGAYEKKWW